jgi:hypothetical protein
MQEGVLQDDLGLADAAEPMDGDGTRLELLVQPLEEGLATDEERATCRQVGDAGPVARVPRLGAQRAWELRLVGVAGYGGSLGGFSRRWLTTSSRRCLAVSRLRPTRSRYTRVRSSPGGSTSSTRTGTSRPRCPVGSLAKAASHSASPKADSR